MYDQGRGAILGPRFAAISADAALAIHELGLPQDANVLDVGTGSGKCAIALALHGYRVVTGEPSTDTTRYSGKDWALNAEKVGVRNRIRFEAFDASTMPFERGAFDAVFFFGVLHHMEESVRGEVFREALRVSNENGAVVFFEPRQKMLEKLWVEDPHHPLAADPSQYVSDPSVRERRLEGAMMDIFIYRKHAAPSLAPDITG